MSALRLRSNESLQHQGNHAFAAKTPEKQRNQASSSLFSDFTGKMIPLLNAANETRPVKTAQDLEAQAGRSLLFP